MHIAINCADLDHSRIDGTRVYIKQCLDRFGALDNYSVFHLYHKTEFNPDLKPELYPNYKNKSIPYSFWWTQTRFGYEINFTLPDVCWMPIQQVPFLSDKRTKLVVTIHDLAFKYFPKHFTFWDRRKLDFFTETAVKRADRIIAVSKSTKKDILKFYPKVDPKKIKVIYHGVERDFFSKKQSPGHTKKVLGKHKIKKDFLLYVGALQPRKNLEVLVDAFEKLREKGRGFQLVLAGEPAWKSEKILERIKNSEFKKDIILTGKVDFKDLPVLYQKAKIFIFPSLYEGFGIPVLEAWASGTPVIVADNSSLKEIGKDAVLKFKPSSPGDLLEKIELLLKRDIIKKRIVKKGLKYLENFSWDKCAKETLDYIKQK